jgi:hypothetical protein
MWAGEGSITTHAERSTHVEGYQQTSAFPFKDEEVAVGYDEIGISPVDARINSAYCISTGPVYLTVWIHRLPCIQSILRVDIARINYKLVSISRSEHNSSRC